MTPRLVPVPTDSPAQAVPIPASGPGLAGSAPEPTGGEFRGLSLSSLFQPIFSAAHSCVVGYEALVRAFDPEGRAVTPQMLFSMPGDEHEDFLLDTVCRSIHLANFMSQQGEGWLFLNVNPMAMLGGQRHLAMFRELLAQHTISPHRVVVEILEGHAREERTLETSIGHFRELGCLIAIDDFGAGQSNFERIWKYKPEIVKLDRSIVARAPDDATVRRTLPSMVSLLHQSGCIVLAEGVQTEREAVIAMGANVDLVQGYHFARPQRALLTSTDCAGQFHSLWASYKGTIREERQRLQAALQPYKVQLETTVRALENGVEWQAAARPLLELPRSRRCYQLDWRGVQIGPALRMARDDWADRRFAPLSDARSADWSRREYFRVANDHPGRVHLSHPYLSLTAARHCVTMSVGISLRGEARVVCVDIEWQDPA